jgi:hypothetical protein
LKNAVEACEPYPPSLNSNKGCSETRTGADGFEGNIARRNKRGDPEGAKRVQNGKVVATYRYFEVTYKKANDVFVIITVKPRW